MQAGAIRDRKVFSMYTERMDKLYPVIGVTVSSMLLVAGVVLAVMITCVWRVFLFTIDL